MRVFRRVRTAREKLRVNLLKALQIDDARWTVLMVKSVVMIINSSCIMLTVVVSYFINHLLEAAIHELQLAAREFSQLAQCIDRFRSDASRVHAIVEVTLCNRCDI